MIEQDEIVDVDAEFEAFFRVTEPLLSCALAAGFGFEVGHDAASEALTYGSRNWDRIAGLANPTGYLYRVGERWAWRQQRRRHGQALFPAGESAALFEPGLGPALAQLSRRQRQAVVLVAGYVMSHSQTAEFLGVSRSSVQNHYERGAPSSAPRWEPTMAIDQQIRDYMDRNTRAVDPRRHPQRAR